MKKINLLLMAMGGALVLSLSSCDKCKDVSCGANGTCVDGLCDCSADYYGDACETKCVNGTYSSGACACSDGYEGAACDVEARAKFMGTYSSSGTIVCGVTGNGTFNSGITVASSSSDKKGVVVTFGGSFTLTGTVNESGVTFASQLADGYNYSGTGSISGSTLTLNISEYDASVPETCVYSITATKQ